jgi:AraC-like DNA-binding protein
MARAAELLSSETLTVREVARQVGYKQPAQFAKAFRRLHGVAPSEFRASATETRVGQHRVASAV